MLSIFRELIRMNRTFVFFVALLCAPFSVASTLLELSFSEVASEAQLIFEGEVLGMESQYVADGTIRTFVRFQIIDVLKGDYTGGTIDLSYLGGQVGTRQMRVSELQMPSVGEVGIYFVESIDEPMLSPLVGWAQGHYLIQRSNGEAFVHTAKGGAVIAINPSAAALSQSNGMSTGTAKGVVVPRSALAQGLSSPMSVDEFKRSVRDVLDTTQPQ